MLNTRLLLLSWVIIMALSGSTLLLQLAAQSRPGCRSRCGNLNIPYPFGMTEGRRDCSYGGLSNTFVIDCDNSTDPPSAYIANRSTGLNAVDISMDNHEIRIMMNGARECYNSSGAVTRRTRSGITLGIFSVSSTKNRFFAVGCDTQATLNGTENRGFSTGCTLQCKSITDVINGSCSGIGCCQASLPINMRTYEISISSYDNHRLVHDFNPCSFAFVAANDYDFNFSTTSLMGMAWERMPVVLEWAVEAKTCEEAQKNMTSYMCKENTNCSDAAHSGGYRCHCKEGYQGNPYLSGPDGCQDIDECKTANRCHKTALCENQIGTYRCYCPHGFEGEGYTNGCVARQKENNSFEMALGVAIGCLLLLLCASLLALGLRRRKATKEREKFFKDNGGLRLQNLLSQHQSYVEILKVFTTGELKRATDNYNESRILGQGGQGTVYKGIMMNDRVVAIKKARLLDRSQVNEFINEVVVLSQINHKNVVRLIGCCLETELPLLVYEFVSNGTLSQHLHDNDGQCSASLCSWKARLRVAAETAGALSYLHSEAAIAIVHRDVKSTNILLDENFTAKVSDFGASRLMPSDKAQLSTLVQGTFGYLDPEYFHSSQLTEKSDVYSFGVVLAELLTGMKAISFAKPEKERTLSLVFVSAVKEDRCLEIIDKRIINEGNVDHIREVALLASRCLKVRGQDRPSMKEVALKLEGLLRKTKQQPWIHQDPSNFEESEYLLRGSHVNYPDTGLINTTGSRDTMKNQLIPFGVEDAR
ncbi:wall-associated receptor kinase 5-like [Punica granatum]|uniref:Wall-associated receptor kinase 5-like n=1 Tax=Punica granatum TaxID=22663 RepID=A0A218XTZ9_PUNGR|nr:wall-associated receptor kinase 5-like [Punica granatum]OWM88507.1 hypothetical protein CDL15_Pgr012673 [Punica granatum]